MFHEHKDYLQLLMLPGNQEGLGFRPRRCEDRAHGCSRPGLGERPYGEGTKVPGASLGFFPQPGRLTFFPLCLVSLVTKASREGHTCSSVSITLQPGDEAGVGLCAPNLDPSLALSPANGETWLSADLCFLIYKSREGWS